MILHDLYNEQCITKSCSNVQQKKSFKHHFYFKICDLDKVRYKMKLCKFMHFEGSDVAYDTWAMAESLDSDINVDLLCKLPFELLEQILSFLQGEETKDQVITTINPNEAIEEITSPPADVVEDDSNAELIKILDNLKTARWDRWLDWFNIFCIFVNEDYPLNIFDSFSRRSNKYNEYDNKRVLSYVKVK